MKDNNIKKFVIIILLLLVVLVSGTTYALFTKTVNKGGVITLKSGTRYIGIYVDNKENLGLNVVYTFTIENRGTEKDESKRAEYVSASAGTPILMDDINTMMVWIPRYSYTLGNTYGYQIEGAINPYIYWPGAFDIKFVDTNTIELGARKYAGDTPSEYFTPSSFFWGDTCGAENEKTQKI